MSSILSSEGINPSTLGLLMFIKLNTGDEYVANILKTHLFEFETDSGKHPIDILDELGYVKYIKTGPKSEPWKKVRLSEKGEKVIKELNKKELHPLAETGYEYLVSQYEGVGQNEKIKNKTKTIFYLSEFLYAKPQYDEKLLKTVLYSYVNSFDYDRQKYMKSTLTLMFNPTNAFAKNWNEEDCPLVDFINKNQSLLRENYKRLHL